MTPTHRIRIIYRKELVDILRDRRTLTAMIVIPVVLYPVIMLGFLWLAQFEESRLKAERFVVAVDDESTRLELESILARVEADRQESSAHRTTFDVRVISQPMPGEDPGVQLHVALESVPAELPLPPRVAVHMTYNEVDIRSRTAMEQLTATLGRFGNLAARESVGAILERVFPEAPARPDIDLVLNPVHVESLSLATDSQRGGWALGQIIPIILVLMTITGAIYPAIDLTAGERERGTLETLMATPVPPLHLIIGKFLVVATVGLLTAVLNLASVGATMHFGGLTRVLTADHPVQFPLHVLPIILLCMVPFALLFAAILIAVCSFARTFKEAQNYVMPVIIAALIPSMAVAVPTIRLQGAMLVLPVGNMVLLARELFQQTCDWTAVVIVLLSTSLYAVAAIALATRLFGQEAVLFVDTGSYKTLLLRRFLTPRTMPSLAQVLLLAAVLFPVSFYVQGALIGDTVERFVDKLQRVALVQFGILFLLVPIAMCVYLKINLRTGLRLAAPRWPAWLAALLLGASSWALAHEFILLQPQSDSMVEAARQIESQLKDAPVWLILLVMACAPALSEEVFFRGFLLTGLGTTLRKWPAIIAAALVFGVFHFMIDRLPLTALLGLVLGYLCWQSGSIWPGVLFHTLHNGSTILLSRFPAISAWLRIPASADPSPTHLPAHIIVTAAGLFLLGLILTGRAGVMRRPARNRDGLV